MKKWIFMQVDERYEERARLTAGISLVSGDRPGFHLMEISSPKSMKKKVDLRMHHI
jgi:hypothetical protein